MVDLDERFRMMDLFDDYVQLLSLAAPPIEALGPPDQSPELARIANDAMAETWRGIPVVSPGLSHRCR